MGKMQGMTTQERMADISKRAGLSEDICRRVLNAESESITESLKKGERANMPGRVTLRPELRQKLVIGGTIENVVKIKAEVSSTLEAAMHGISSFDEPKEEVDNGIRLRQIESLL